MPPPKRTTFDPEPDETIQFPSLADNSCGPLKLVHPLDGVYLYIPARFAKRKLFRYAFQVKVYTFWGVMEELMLSVE
jgi:hypothetical protein